MIRGSCHCGAISFAAARTPEWLTACNCSICRRVGALWAHFPRDNVAVSAPPDGTIEYIHGDKTLVLHTCGTCGCTPYWVGVGPGTEGRMAVNARMCEPADIADLPVRHFDGAETWKFLD